MSNVVCVARVLRRMANSFAQGKEQEFCVREISWREGCAFQQLTHGILAYIHEPHFSANRPRKILPTSLRGNESTKLTPAQIQSGSIRRVRSLRMPARSCSFSATTAK